MNKHEEVEKWKKSLGICPKCGEIRALTVREVNTDPLLPDFIKELIVPILLRQREMQRKVATSIELAYRRGKQEGEEGKANST